MGRMEMDDEEKLEYIHHAIQEALDGEHTEDVDFEILETALEFVEELQEPHKETKDA